MGGTNIVLREASSGLVVSPAMSVSAMLGGIVAGDLLLVGVSLDGPVTIAIHDRGHDRQLVHDDLDRRRRTVRRLPRVRVRERRGSETVNATSDTTPNTSMQIQFWDFGGIAANGFDDCAQAAGQSLATDGAATRALDVSATNELVFGWGVFFMTGTTGTGFASLSDFDGDPAECRIAPARSRSR